MTVRVDSLAPDLAEPDPNYRAVLDWIWSFSARVRGASEMAAQRAAKLARMRALLRSVGDPQRAYPSVLVAGTKGKGSSVAMLAACLHAGGRRTARYTSPHLVNWRERTCIDALPIPAETVLELAGPVRAAVAGLPSAFGQPTTFEVGTALALLYFAREGVDVAVVEVGVGGREDATNLVEPLVSVITPISYDHTATLGETLEAIAGHKAGILRPGRPGVLAPQPPAAREVVLAEAARLGASLDEVGPGRDWWWLPGPVPAGAAQTAPEPASPTEGASDSARAGLGRLAPAARHPIRILSRRAEAPLDVQLALLGEHQRDNAVAAVAAACALGRVRPDLAVPRQALVAGLGSVEWPGRLQVLRESPLVVLDGAHNAASAVVLRRALDDVLRYDRLHLVLGLTAGKDARGVLEALGPAAATLHLTRSRHERSAPPEELAALAHTLIAPGAGVEVAPDPEIALEAALAAARSTDLVLVTGSLFLVGEALVWWRQQRSPR